MEALRTDYDRCAESSEVAAKVTAGLQEDYCRIIPSIATERKKNMIYIETAKREVEKEMIFMGAKIRKIDELRSTLEETTKMIKDKN